MQRVCTGWNYTKLHLEVLKMMIMLVVSDVCWVRQLWTLVPNNLSFPRNPVSKLYTAHLHVHILPARTVSWCFILIDGKTMTEIRDLILASPAVSWQNSPGDSLFFFPKIQIVIFFNVHSFLPVSTPDTRISFGQIQICQVSSFACETLFLAGAWGWEITNVTDCHTIKEN